MCLHCRISYSGSILNPQAANPPSIQKQPPAFNVSKPGFSSVKPVYSPPRAPSATAPPSKYTPPSYSPSPLSPPIKQAAPVPWLPSDGKTRDLPCGDSTAHRGTSTYYSSAPLDPSKVPVCNNCHTNIR